MPAESLMDRFRKIVIEYGPWTAHNIRLPGDLFTIRKDDEPMSRIRARRTLQIVSDLLRRPIGELRVLDLGCLEGGFSIEFGMWGAEVVGIDGRAANIAKAEFAREALQLKNVSFLREDIRGLRATKHGTFDVVLCLGVFYHLPQKDLLPFLHSLRAMTRSIVILDTHISLSPEKIFTAEGQTLSGRTFLEHPPGSTALQREKALWKSLDTEDSFWLTEASLLRALHTVGFTSVHACLHPPSASTPIDRKTYVVCAGKPVQPRVMSPREIPAAFECSHYEPGQDPLMRKQS